jgi:hypothetical protein
VKNTKYAKFLVQSELEALPDGQELDVTAFLAERAAEDQYKAAFGVAVAAPTQIEKPANNSPNPGNPPPPPPGPTPLGGTVKNAKEMTPAEFQAHLAGLGAHLGGS